ncbi:MAG: DUF1593 domain-containing protein [Bacteroidetes bacterium]|nr:MAG: DUF1593 domain-containing protein [Bacteroidota bacterium]
MKKLNCLYLFPVIILLNSFLCNGSASKKKETAKPRIIVTTDGEIDDKTSFMRFLLYSNEFETEGLIYGNSKWQRHGHGVVWMQEMIDEYGKIRPNLLKHLPGYPAVDELKKVIYAGNMDEKYLHYSGPLETDGAKHLINVLLDKNPEPVWVQAWGGTNTIAQALSIMKRDYSVAELDRVYQKLWIFAIADQDSTSAWIRENFPKVKYIRSHQFVALNYQHEGHPYSNHTIFDPAWTTENVKEGHGNYGKLYAQKYFSEGDSPAFFHLIGNGLRAHENPAYGGWGGRFETKNGVHFFDAADDGDWMKPQWRWLLDIQNDFAARMDWCESSFENANHYPEIKISSKQNFDAKPGQTISVDASKSTDPDGDKLNYKWYFYNEPSTLKNIPEIKNPDKSKMSFQIPVTGQSGTLHLILEVKDSGEPALKKYKRIIINVKP